MGRDKINFGIILRMAFSLIPLLFGMPFLATVLCAYNIVMSFVVFGPLNAIVSGLTATLFSMLFCGLYGEAEKLQGLFIALEIILCSAACIYSSVFTKRFYQGVALTALGYLVPSFISLKGIATKTGLSVVDYLVTAPMETLKLQLQSIPEEAQMQMGITNEHINSIIELSGVISSMIVPAVLIIVSLFTGYVIMWCVAAQLRKHPSGFWHSFSEIKLPRKLFVLLIVSVAATILLFKTEYLFIPVNLIVVILTVCSFAGLSFVEFFLRKGIKKPLLRVIVHLLIFLGWSSVTATLPFLNIVVVYSFIAILDSFFNFRKLSPDSKMRGDSDEAETETGNV